VNRNSVRSQRAEFRFWNNIGVRRQNADPCLAPSIPLPHDDIPGEKLIGGRYPAFPSWSILGSSAGPFAIALQGELLAAAMMKLKKRSEMLCCLRDSKMPAVFRVHDEG
jgi:hypothetical protein